MGVGWNLGNTLDASKTNVKDPANDNYWYNQGLGSENYWGQPNTKKELMKMMKEAGFGAIRVPVTWYNHMDKSGKVDATWMKRVHEIVDYVIDNGMYCIINVHHDTGADSDSHISWIKADEQNYNNNKERYEYLWKQIAEEFKDYDKHLLFEGYNEMLDTKSSWCFASFNTSSYDASLAASAYNGLNGYAQSFVNAVRATGGNNESRNLIVNTYAAANGYGTWNTHLKDVLTKLNIPEDNVSGHLAVEVHDYPNLTNNNTNRTISDIKSQVNGTIKVLKDNIISKGIPVIIGEWGTSNVDAGAGKTDYDVRRDLMFQFVDYYIKQAKANDIATFYWMGLTDGFYREGPSFHQADLAEKITKAYHGDDFKGVYPKPENATSYICFEGDKMLDWGNAITIPAEIFKSVGDKAQLELTYKLEISDYDDIQLCKGGDWSKVNFKVDNKSFTGDLNPKSYYKTTNGKTLTTVFTFDNTTYNTLSQSGLIIQGHGIRLYKAVLFDPSATGIEHAMVDNTHNDGIYNLAGQRVKNITKGLYIKNGKKFIVR